LTIHAVMGCTVPTLVTQVGLSKQMALWEAAQTVVTLSRTRLPSDMWFIGDPTETIDVLWQALLSTDQFSVYVTHLLDTLCSRSHEKQFVINQTRWHPFRACDMELPKTNDLCSYMLASRRETSVVYVGSTNNMRRRYDEHNSKVGGSTSTGLVNLKPWGLLGYVVGFSCRHDASIFEFKWKAIIQTERRGSRDLPTMTRLFLARQVISEWLDPGELKLVICGQV
jgi:predicted GIY-YIG superfamily endonuclease